MSQFIKGRYYVTEKGAGALQKELEELEDQRGVIAENIRVAKGYGDLSENFEYHEARREAGMVEGRMMQLKEVLNNLEVVHPDDVPSDEVSFGCVVSVRDSTGDEYDITIVGPLEAEPLKDLISYESPLGAALMGQKVGDRVEAQVPDGVIEYEILAIQPYGSRPE